MQILGSRAKYFVGTAKSHFSKEIYLERKLQQGGDQEFYENTEALIQIAPFHIVKPLNLFTSGGPVLVLPVDLQFGFTCRALKGFSKF